jgi:hypothetical protein
VVACAAWAIEVTTIRAQATDNVVMISPERRHSGRERAWSGPRAQGGVSGSVERAGNAAEALGNVACNDITW